MQFTINTDHIQSSIKYLLEQENQGADEAILFITDVFDYPDYKDVYLAPLSEDTNIKLCISTLSESNDLDVIDFIELLKILLTENAIFIFEVKRE